MAQVINSTEGVKEINVPETPKETVKRAKKEAPKVKVPAGSEKVTINVKGQTGKENEVRCFRINCVPYFIKTDTPVEVPKFLADHIMGLKAQKKVNAQLLSKYTGEGASLGDLA